MTLMMQRSLIAAVMVMMAAVTGANADEVADFYKGKTFTIVAGHEVGTGFDIYGRTLQRHLSRHRAAVIGFAGRDRAHQAGVPERLSRAFRVSPARPGHAAPAAPGRRGAPSPLAQFS